MYRCIHCEEIFEDGAKEILEGCSKCRGKFFFYIKPEKAKEILENKEIPELSSIEKKQMEKDVRDIMGEKDTEAPIFLDFESIKVLKPGKYLLDLGRLFEMNKPRVYQLEDGKYIVDLTPQKRKLKEVD